MKIAFNPSTVAALIAPPNNKDITFDLRGHNIFARGVKFCGTDTNTWRDIKINNVSIDSNILDLRDGDNTTLTNINGVVTINSTWRPVVDNLTSDSTTSSLSANQGRVLKSLIDGKSDSDHNHDDRYLKLTGGTISGRLLVNSDSNSYTTPSIAINYYDSYTVNDYSITQIKMGNPKYDMYLGLSPAVKGRYGKIGYFMHADTDCEFLWGTSGWIKRMALECSSGNLWVSGSITAGKFHSNASASTDLTVIPPDTAIALETGNGNGVVNSWIWRENYTSSNWGIFHNNSEDDSINFVGNNRIRVKISLGSNSLKVGGTEVSLEGHNHDGRYVRYYAVTTLDCNNLAVGLTAAGVSATNAAHPNHSAYLYISDVGTPFQIQIPDSSVPYIYKRCYSSGTWSEWFKLNAGYADSAGSVAWNNVTGKPSSYTPSAHTHSWTSITDKLVAGNEFNIVNAGFNKGMWFNYVPINDRSKTATITGYHFGNGATGYTSINASGFIKKGSNSNYVLLGDGGHKLESSLSVANADTVDGEHAAAFTRIVGRNSIGTSGTAPYNYIHLFRIANSSGYSTIDCEIDFRTRYHSAKLEIRISTAQYPYNSGGSSISIVKKIISGRTCKFWVLSTIQSSNYNYYDVYYESGAWNSGSYGIIFKGSNGSVVFVHKGINLASLPDKVIEVTNQWVSWDAIAGKPTSFTPSAHNHDGRYLRLSGDDTMTGQIKSNYSAGSWINGCTHAIIVATYKGYNSLIAAPIKSGNVCISAWNAEDNLNFGYAKTGKTDNNFDKRMYWDAPNNNLHADYFTGHLSGTADNAVNSDTVDGYHANGLLTALSNTNNGISVTVGGTTKSISNISVNYAASAGSANSAIQATNLTPENTPHYFRDPNNSIWRGGMYWGNAGNESMSFVAANGGTRFQFVGGSDIANWTSSTWQSVTPYLTIYSSGIVTPGSVTATNGFHHVNHDNNDAVLLAGGGYSQGVPVRYWAIYYIYIGKGPADVTYTKRSGNYNFITSKDWESEGAAIFNISFPSGYNKNNTLIFGNGDHCTSSWQRSPVYVTITTSTDFSSESKIRVLLSNDSSLDTGYANIYFMCMG